MGLLFSQATLNYQIIETNYVFMYLFFYDIFLYVRAYVQLCIHV